MAIRWTDSEVVLLREAASSHTVIELAGMFGKTTGAIYQACRKLEIEPQKDRRGPQSSVIKQERAVILEQLPLLGTPKEDANGRLWTEEEDALLRGWGATSTLPEMAEMLSRTVKSVRFHCVKLGVTPLDARGAAFRKKSGPRNYKPDSGIKAWTEEDLTLLRTLAPTMPLRSVAERLGRNERAVAWAVHYYQVTTRGRGTHTEEERLARSAASAVAQQRRHEEMWTEVERTGQRGCVTCGVVRLLAEFYFDSKAQRPYATCKWCLRAKSFGLTAQQLEFLFETQDWRCALCGEQEVKTSIRGRVHVLSVDHDHECCPAGAGCSDCIRGLLCDTCNLALGKLESKPLVAVRFADYLVRRPLAHLVEETSSV